jgi:Mrp family chromosome partitioning ATPase
VDAAPTRELQRVLESTPEAGLDDLLDLSGDLATLLPYIATDTVCENVFLLAAESSLIMTPAMPAVLDSIRQSYDIALIDTPSLEVSPDARVLGRLADGVVLVETTGEGNRSAIQQLQQDGAVVIGSIANRIS